MRLGVAVVLVTGLALAAGYALHDTCNYTPWHGDWQYQHYCYNDVIPLWFGHHLDEGAVPYFDDDAHNDTNEYPVLTAGFMWTAAKVSKATLEPLGVPPLQAYVELTFALLTLAAAVATWALWRLRMPAARLFAWILAPTLAIHGLTNWDLLAVAFAATGWLAWRSGRPFASALLFGLGGACKLYPAFFLPFLLVAVLARRDVPAAGRVLAGGTLGFGVPNLAVAVPVFGNWLRMWRFHAARAPDFETPWSTEVEPAVRWLTHGFDDPDWWARTAGWVGAAAMLLGLAWLAWRAWRAGPRRLDPLVAGTLLTVAFLLVSKVYSPQYTLWALPLLLLAEAPLLPVLLYVAADTANFLVRYQYMSTIAWNEAWQPWSRLAVDLRWLLLLWCAASLLVRHGLLRPRPGWRWLAGLPGRQDDALAPAPQP